MIIFHTILLRIDHFGPVPLVPFCAMRDSICFIPVVCKKQASQELLLWYGLALYEFTSMVSSFSIIWNTVWSINYVAARDCLDFHQLISMYVHCFITCWRVVKNKNLLYFSGNLPINPKIPGLFWGVLFGEMKFVLSNCLSSEDLSISYESWDVQLTFDTLVNAFRFKV